MINMYHQKHLFRKIKKISKKKYIITNYQMVKGAFINESAHLEHLIGDMQSLSSKQLFRPPTIEASTICKCCGLWQIMVESIGSCHLAARVYNSQRDYGHLSATSKIEAIFNTSIDSFLKTDDQINVLADSIQDADNSFSNQYVESPQTDIFQLGILGALALHMYRKSLGVEVTTDKLEEITTTTVSQPIINRL